MGDLWSDIIVVWLAFCNKSSGRQLQLAWSQKQAKHSLPCMDLPVGINKIRKLRSQIFLVVGLRLDKAGNKGQPNVELADILQSNGDLCFIQLNLDSHSECKITVFDILQAIFFLQES